MAEMKDIELRDWFAGQALGGILSNSQYPPQSSGEPLPNFFAAGCRASFISSPVTELMDVGLLVSSDATSTTFLPV